jgi:hypothetical protein
MINQVAENTFNKDNSANFSTNGCCLNQRSKLNFGNNILPTSDDESRVSFRLLKRKNCESKMILRAVRSEPSPVSKFKDFLR